MICKTCNQEFGRFAIIDGKKHDLHNRKDCINCVPFGKRIYTNSFGKVFNCIECGKSYLYTKNCRSSTKKCKDCYSYVRRRQLKQQSVDYKGGKCEVCGYDKCLAALDFHHIDPNKKEFGIGTGHTRRWESIKSELDKCKLLCANCHRETHDRK